MRTLSCPILSFLAAAIGCSGGPTPYQAPPTLHITSPARSLIQSSAGPITVTGTVTPSEDDIPVETVTVNDVAATVSPDGSFQATIQVAEGASFIETVARDSAGGEAFDTRAVHAGEQRTAGNTIENGLAVSLSTDAFKKIGDTAGPILRDLDINGILAPIQPIQHTGDPNGEDCLFERLFINDVKLGDVKIALKPVRGGLSLRVEIDNLSVAGFARYAALFCLTSQTNLRASAGSVVVTGTLLVSPNGLDGFKTDLVNETVTQTGFQFDASGIPGDILNLLNLDDALGTVASKVLESELEPLLNLGLGALAGTKQVDVLGKSLSFEVVPSDISFDAVGAQITLDTKVLVSGAERAKFTFIENGTPTMDGSDGIQIGLSDDLANEVLSEAQAAGLLNLSMPSSGGTFDNADLAMTLPPMISADPKDGSLKVIIGDMMLTYTSQGVPVARAAVNASIDLQVESAGNGYAIALKLGTPKIKFTVVDDIPNLSLMTDADLAKASETGILALVGHVAELLVNIPIPSVVGVQMRDATIGSDSGYVMVTANVE